jgi:hypothetical protein
MTQVRLTLHADLGLEMPSNTGYQMMNTQEGSGRAESETRVQGRSVAPARACRPTTRVGSWLRHVVRRAPVPGRYQKLARFSCWLEETDPPLGSDTHCHARRPFSLITVRASP